MASRLTAAIVLLALLSACASQRVVRLDTGQGEPLEYRPPSNKSVKVDEEAFEEALTQLVLEVPLTLRPSQQGWLVRASYPSNDEGTRWQSLMSKSFGGICEPGQRKETCLSLLDDLMGLSKWDKLGVALGLSIDPLKESISKAVEKTLAPQLFYTVIATGLISWAVLAANPEPVFTKAAAIVSAALLIYLGVETFLELVDASRELKWATDRATTWEELERASKRFANRVGPEVARVFVLAVTVVVSHGMTGGSAWLASRLAMLPSFSEAAALGASQLRLTLSEIGQVSAVAVSAEGTITITLAPTAVAMTGQGPSGGSKPENQKPQTQEQYKAPKSGVSGKEGAKDVPSWAKGERPKVNESGKDFAKRLLDKKYGEGNYDKGPGSEFSKIQKWGDRAFENP
ncbi:hypothetical protein [Vitiosangium sp. GDMCC 1.1324]|uniref:SitA5 family polymorphic toxin n=1 Tax=Vitiosangium sp. (strain GDMCC 1.1324) TaxID=2138576 RepID=UPI000D37B73A|nr:hypothetical protein [Vitiosangium sp. GDMCC 1.1324]PTL75476.1 hypothetical protein DAT35_54425 [Vitiosangium sp. GDMCC 1.1324]